MIASSDSDSDTLPPLLLATIRALLAGAFACVMAFPLLAVVDLAQAARGSGSDCMDSGANTVKARTVLSLLALLCGMLWLARPRAWNAGRRPLHLALAALLLAWGVASGLSVAPADSAQQFVKLLLAVVVLLVARDVCCTARSFQFTVNAWLGVTFLVSLIGFALYKAQNNADSAVIGTFYQADVAAGWLLMAVPLALGLAVTSTDRTHTRLYALVALVTWTALLLTYSRGGQLAAIVTILCLMPYWARRVGPRGVLLPLVVGALVLGLSGLLTSSGAPRLIPSRAVARTAELGHSDTSVQARLAFWKGAWDMCMARPVDGWGPGTFGRIFPRFQTDVRYYSKHVHNQYLAYAAEGGLLMLGAFLVFVAVLGRALWRSHDPLVVALGASLLAALMHLFVDVDWEFFAVQLTWFGLAGMALGGAEVARGAVPAPARRSLLMHLPLALALAGLFYLAPRPLLAEQQIAAARAAERHNNEPAAVQHATQATLWMPYDSQAWRALADALMMTAEREPRDGAGLPLLDRAVQAGQRAVQLDPERAVCWDVLARAALAKGDANLAADALENALRRDPVNYPDFYNALADLYVNAKRIDEALRLLAVPAAMFPPDVFNSMWHFRRDELHRQLARTYIKQAQLLERQGRLPEARGAMVRAVQMDPDSILARFQLGMLDMALRDPGAAWIQFREIQRRKPQHPMSLWLLASAYRELGEMARADGMLREAYKKMPQLERVGRPNEPPLRIPQDFFTSEGNSDAGLSTERAPQ